MQIQAKDVEEYISKIPEDRQEAFQKLVDVIKENIPKGFHLTMQYSMPNWVVPLSDYPAGYHCTPNTPLPFLGAASQKNFISVYHMGIYANPELLEWFQTEFPKYSKKKLDMGKSCMRFKKPEDIPFELIGQLCQKMTPKDWISLYERAFLKNK